MSRHSRLPCSLPRSALAGIALVLAMPLSAQAASYAYIDQKAPYRNNGALTALNLPKVGTTFKVQVPFSGWGRVTLCWWANCPYPQPYYDYYSVSYLAFGVRNPNLPISALGGYLFSSAEIVMPTPWTKKTLREWQQSWTTMSFAIPNSPQLVGVKFYQQVLVHNVSFYPSPWAGTYSSLSRGGYGVIGK